MTIITTTMIRIIKNNDYNNIENNGDNDDNNNDSNMNLKKMTMLRQ